VANQTRSISHSSKSRDREMNALLRGIALLLDQVLPLNDILDLLHPIDEKTATALTIGVHLAAGMIIESQVQEETKTQVETAIMVVIRTMIVSVAVEIVTEVAEGTVLATKTVDTAGTGETDGIQYPSTYM